MAEEKVYNIPLREAYKKARVRRTPFAVRAVREYVMTHAKVGEVKIGSHLNEALWTRSIKKPPRRIRVKVIKDGNTAKAELIGFDYVEFKAKPKTETKGMRERLTERLTPKAKQQQELEDKIEGKKPAAEKQTGATPTPKKEETKPEPKKEAKPTPKKEEKKAEAKK